MKQLRQGLEAPPDLSTPRCHRIKPERATVLATKAMHFAHSLLAMVSTKTQAEVNLIFVHWWEDKGKDLLTMCKSEARYGVGVTPEDEFDEEPPHPTYLLWSTWLISFRIGYIIFNI